MEQSPSSFPFLPFPLPCSSPPPPPHTDTKGRRLGQLILFSWSVCPPAGSSPPGQLCGAAGLWITRGFQPLRASGPALPPAGFLQLCHHLGHVPSVSGLYILPGACRVLQASPSLSASPPSPDESRTTREAAPFRILNRNQGRGAPPSGSPQLPNEGLLCERQPRETSRKWSREVGRGSSHAPPRPHS